MSRDNRSRLPTIAKQAYFIKRLRDSGYAIDRLVPAYNTADPRMWTILINPKSAGVLCTCYVNNGLLDEVNPKSQVYFEVFDGGQFMPGRFTIDTQSIEVFVSTLIKFGIEPIKEFTKVSVSR